MDSPCRKICILDDDGETCIGCGRSWQEISGWWDMSDAQRAEIMARVKDFQPPRTN